jgi:hypothetical protein
MVVSSHESLRHCADASQTPSPFASPHALSFGSQTPEAHTRAPTAAVHVATDEGVDGSGVPFASFGTHMPGVLPEALHQSAGMQSVSTRQPETQRPVPVSQMSPA